MVQRVAPTRLPHSPRHEHVGSVSIDQHGVGRSRRRAADQIALQLLATFQHQERALALGLHAFGDYRNLQRPTSPITARTISADLALDSTPDTKVLSIFSLSKGNDCNPDNEA